jgi:tRNA(Ile)-lysidine synthase
VTAAAFDAAMTPFRIAPGARIAVAVSGGSDSMALVGLLADWVRARDVQLHALTIDHRLRDAAAGEAAQVAAWLAAARVPHTILTWEEGRAARDVKRSAQSAARAARYRLMTGWCTAHDCTHLFVAHHADDQVETFFQRLARGSGVDGLAAMAPAIMRDGIVIARPLLAFPKGMLEQVCRDLGQPWIEDPSNASTASGRVRFRQARDVLAREGLTRERLLATVAHLQRARAALDHAVAGLLGEAVWDAYGAVRLPVAALLSVPEEIGLRTLARLLMGVSGQEFGPRFENLARLYARITVGPWRDATLHGAVVSREGTDLVIAREPAQVGEDKTLTADNSVIWDGRFKLTLTAAVPMCFTVTGCAAVRDVTESGTSALSKVPARARSVIPALIDSHGLAAIPHTGYMRADVAALEGLSLALVQLSRTRAGVEPPDAKL